MATNPPKPKPRVSREIVRDGDFIVDHVRSAYGLVHEARPGYRVEWVDGRRIGHEDRFRRDELDRMVDNGQVEILDSNIGSADEYERRLIEQRGDTLDIDAGDLTIVRERSRSEVNEFLDDPVVDHKRGSVQFCKAMFGARYQGELIAVCVLSHPNASTIDTGTKIVLERYASHPKRPQSTATYLIKRAIEWARLEGYDEMLSYAGVDEGNTGHMYHFLDFEFDGHYEYSGDGWTNRDGRDSWEDYEGRRYRLQIHPGDGANRQIGDSYENTPDVSLLSFTETPNLDDMQLVRYDGNQSAVEAFWSRHDISGDVPDVSDEIVIFGASHRGRPYAMAILGTGNDHAGVGCDTLCIERYAHAGDAVDYPTNVGAWLVAKARTWGRLEGFDRIESRPTRETTDPEDAVYARAGFDQSTALADGGETACERHERWVSETRPP